MRWTRGRAARGACARAGVLLAIVGAGCVTGSSGVPYWAMHVRPAAVDPAALPAQLEARLVAELNRPGDRLAARHLAPEQIGVAALREIEAGHAVDGALWLAIASYRYHEEAVEAVTAGYEEARTLPVNVRRKAYFELVNAEIDRYIHLDFNDELDVLHARVYRPEEAEKALQQQMAELGKTTAIERESVRDALWELRRDRKLGETASRYPALVEAFRARLRRHFAADARDEHPGAYLALTPVLALQREAVLAAVDYFEPLVCAGVASAFPALRPDVVAALDAPRPQARANAAATLALAPSPETRALLEERLKREPDAQVKLVLAYALVHHGVPEHALAVAAALQSCAGQACTLPVKLARWLPKTAKADVDRGALARIAATNDCGSRAHLFAAASLKELAREKPLDAATVDALIIAARRRNNDEEKRAAQYALGAIADAEVLSRAVVLARIEGRGAASPEAGRLDALFPGPLLARLAAMATGEDLPLLGRMMQRFGEADGPERHIIVDAVLRMPGAEADARLVNWFNLYAGVRAQIIVGLVGRPTIPRAQLERLAVRGGARTQIIVKTMSHAADAPATLLAYLRGGDIRDRLDAAELAALTGPMGQRNDLFALLRFHDDRYYPNDVLVRHAALASLLHIALAAAPAGAPVASGPATAE